MKSNTFFQKILNQKNIYFLGIVAVLAQSNSAISAGAGLNPVADGLQAIPGHSEVFKVTDAIVQQQSQTSDHDTQEPSKHRKELRELLRSGKKFAALRNYALIMATSALVTFGVVEGSYRYLTNNFENTPDQLEFIKKSRELSLLSAVAGIFVGGSLGLIGHGLASDLRVDLQMEYLLEKTNAIDPPIQIKDHALLSGRHLVVKLTIEERTYFLMKVEDPKEKVTVAQVFVTLGLLLEPESKLGKDFSEINLSRFHPSQNKTNGFFQDPRQFNGADNGHEILTFKKGVYQIQID